MLGNRINIQFIQKNLLKTPIKSYFHLCSVKPGEKACWDRGIPYRRLSEATANPTRRRTRCQARTHNPGSSRKTSTTSEHLGSDSLQDSLQVRTALDDHNSHSQRPYHKAETAFRQDFEKVTPISVLCTRKTPEKTCAVIPSEVHCDTTLRLHM